MPDDESVREMVIRLAVERLRARGVAEDDARRIAEASAPRYDKLVIANAGGSVAIGFTPLPGRLPRSGRRG